jgi:glutathionylspermidine synthase
VKDPYKDPGLPRSLSIVASKPGRADAIDQETNNETPTRRSSEHLKEPLSCLVGGEDIKLHIHAHRRRVDSGLKGFEKQVPVVKNLTPLPRNLRRYIRTGSFITGRNAHGRVFSS